MAKLAGVPRATWAHVESGGGNPTLGVLDRVATALQVTLEELVAPRGREVRKVPRAELREKRRGLAVLRVLLPDPIPGMELERFELPPRARFPGVPHTAGTREYLTCERGALELVVGGATFRLDPGDVVVFRGDQRHAYANVGPGTAVAYSVVVFAR